MIAPATTSPHIGQPLSIGPVDLQTNLLLAPVAKYCDLAWRIVCREQGGLGLACTDLLSPQGLLRGTATSLDLARTSDLDQPICMQLYGGDGDMLAEGAAWAVRHGAHVIDINMGCPVDKVTKKDGGSMLLCNPDRTVGIAAKIVLAVERAARGRVPVTAKVRLGWDDSCLVAPELAARLERIGIQLITVHGRTTEQRFRGRVRLPGIRDVVQAVDHIPVIGNGDVTDAASAMRMLSETGCHGLMIGRGSFSAPWLFRQIWAVQQHESNRWPARAPQKHAPIAPTDIEPHDLNALAEHLSPEPTEAEKLDIIRRYFSLMLEYRTQRYAINHIRRRITWFGKRLGPCKPMKERVRNARTPDEVFSALDEFQAGGLRLFPKGEHMSASTEPVAAG